MNWRVLSDILAVTDYPTAITRPCICIGCGRLGRWYYRCRPCNRLLLPLRIHRSTVILDGVFIAALYRQICYLEPTDMIRERFREHPDPTVLHRTNVYLFLNEDFSANFTRPDHNQILVTARTILDRISRRTRRLRFDHQYRRWIYHTIPLMVNNLPHTPRNQVVGDAMMIIFQESGYAEDEPTEDETD